MISLDMNTPALISPQIWILWYSQEKPRDIATIPGEVPIPNMRQKFEEQKKIIRFSRDLKIEKICRQ